MDQFHLTMWRKQDKYSNSLLNKSTKLYILSAGFYINHLFFQSFQQLTGRYYYLHFTDEETEGKVTMPALEARCPSFEAQLHSCVFAGNPLLSTAQAIQTRRQQSTPIRHGAGGYL